MRLQHVFETSKHVHMVMEHMEGGNAVVTGEALRGLPLYRCSAGVVPARTRDRALGHETQQRGSSNITSARIASLIDFGMATQWGREGATDLDPCCTRECVAPDMFTGAYTDKVAIESRSRPFVFFSLHRSLYPHTATVNTFSQRPNGLCLVVVPSSLLLSFTSRCMCTVYVLPFSPHWKKVRVGVGRVGAVRERERD